MTGEARRATPPPILNSIEAQLFVANIKISCDFYTNRRLRRSYGVPEPL
jgi:hypothetical protein